LCRGRSHGGEKRRGGDAGHEQALDAAAQRVWRWFNKAKDSPESRPMRAIAQYLRPRAEI
jgi:hypothetical protein